MTLPPQDEFAFPSIEWVSETTRTEVNDQIILIVLEFHRVNTLRAMISHSQYRLERHVSAMRSFTGGLSQDARKVHAISKAMNHHTAQLVEASETIETAWMEIRKTIAAAVEDFHERGGSKNITTSGVMSLMYQHVTSVIPDLFSLDEEEEEDSQHG